MKDLDAPAIDWKNILVNTLQKQSWKGKIHN